MQPYQYKPLPNSSDIRILILHPAADTSSLLECDIITKDRLTILRGPDNKTFDAVSYVWGNGAHDIPLYCKSEGTYLYISGVVDEMLRSLRKRHKERRMWVDTICLNQKDNQEKSIQVQQMGQIYHMADKVHIWLGPAEATTPLAFAFLRTLVAKFEPLPGQAKDPTTEEILQTFEETFQHRNFQSFLDLLQKSWFTRRWTLQECFLARDTIIRCGGSKVSWHWFTEGLKFIQNKSQELPGVQSDHGALYALDVLKTLQKPADLLSLLWTLHMSECSDPKDRIYSLLGLTPNVDPDGLGGQEAPIPDYELSADAVYRVFVRQCISKSRFCEILLHIDAFGSLSDVNPEWPSWVPNWTRARDRRLNSPTATRRIMPSSNCIHESPEPHLRYLRMIDGDRFLYPLPTEYSNGNHHGLVIYGKSIQKIVQVCDTWPSTNNSDYLVEYLTDWIHKGAILHLPKEWLDESTMNDEVKQLISCLNTGIGFFGYMKPILLQSAMDTKPSNGRACVRVADIELSTHSRKCQTVASIVYPMVPKPSPYTIEQVRSKEHLMVNWYRDRPPIGRSRHELSDFLDGISRMMREGKKRLIVASCEDDSRESTRRHWIAPNDVRVGDVVTDITYCGRVGALLRPIHSPPELNRRPVFHLIGILWSLRDIHALYPVPGITRDSSLPNEFLIL